MSLNVIVLFGDGIKDRIVWECFLSRVLPDRQDIFHTPATIRRIGLKAILDVVKELIIRGFKFDKCMVIIDREHIFKYSTEDMIKAFRSLGFKVEHVKGVLQNAVFKFTCKCGPARTTIYITILGPGERGRLEDHLLKLLRTKYGYTLQLDKERIQKFIRERARSLRSFLMSVDKKT